MDNNTVQGLTHVEATLNYLAAGAERPVSYAYTPPPGTPQTTRRNSPHTVTIRNARPILSQLSLDQHGFVLTHQASKVTNFYDEHEVRAVYYPEVERLLPFHTELPLPQGVISGGAVLSRNFLLDGPVEESHHRADVQEREVQRQVLAAERQRVTGLRDQGVISDDILQRIERERDLEEARREQP